MNTALWIAQILLGLAFIGAGVGKLTQSREKLHERMDWVEDFSQPTIKFVGLAETLGALGLILPAATGIAVILTPIAAVGIGIVQVLAATVHLRRQETQVIRVNLLFLALAVFIAWGRFGPYPLQ